MDYPRAESFVIRLFIGGVMLFCVCSLWAFAIVSSWWLLYALAVIVTVLIGIHVAIDVKFVRLEREFDRIAGRK